jgi:SAM-dependent methyltransferase
LLRNLNGELSQKAKTQTIPKTSLDLFELLRSKMISSLGRVKSTLRHAVSSAIARSKSPPAKSPEWKRLQELLSTSKRLIDLGCGSNPHPKAQVAVDAFIEPIHRNFGFGQELNVHRFQEEGGLFAQADLESLPFADKAFDFAYSHHVFEHLSDPKKACSEMCRIAHRGAIITPSVFVEIAFGRPYHLWLVLARGNTLFFVRKMPYEDRPFGEHPVPRKVGGYRVTEKTNPFDILLNQGNWYHGIERMHRLSRLLRYLLYSHSPVYKVIFLWEGKFDCVVIHQDGSIE